MGQGSRRAGLRAGREPQHWPLPRRHHTGRWRPRVSVCPDLTVGRVTGEPLGEGGLAGAGRAPLCSFVRVDASSKWKEKSTQHPGPTALFVGSTPRAPLLLWWGHPVSGGAALWETAGDRTKAQRGPGSQGVPQPSTPWPDASLWLRTGLRGRCHRPPCLVWRRGWGTPWGTLKSYTGWKRGPDWLQIPVLELRGGWVLSGVSLSPGQRPFPAPTLGSAPLGGAGDQTLAVPWPSYTWGTLSLC